MYFSFFVGYLFADERLNSESGKGSSPHPQGIWQCFMWKGAASPESGAVSPGHNFPKVLEQHTQERPAHSSLPPPAAWCIKEEGGKVTNL